MKKFFYSVLAAATMLFATTSCSQDNEILGSDTPLGGNTQKVTFKVAMPEEGVSSRAIAQGVEVSQANMANKLAWALYEVNYEDGTPLATGAAEKEADSKEFSVTIDMVKGLEYKVLFLAYNEEGTIFDVADGDDLKSLNYKSTVVSNEEAYDAFVACHAHKVNDEKVTTVTLYRPFAQINVGTTDDDLKKAENLNATVVQSEMTIENVPTQYNVLTGEVSEYKKVTYAKNGILKDYDTDKNEILEVEDKTYNYLNMVYVLAGEGTTTESTHKANFTFYREDAPQIVREIEIENLPIERNFRTNIIGTLITQAEMFKIVIDERFETPDKSAEEEDGTYVVANDATDLQTLLNNDEVANIGLNAGQTYEGTFTYNKTIDKKILTVNNGSRTGAEKAIIKGRVNVSGPLSFEDIKFEINEASAVKNSFTGTNYQYPAIVMIYATAASFEGCDFATDIATGVCGINYGSHVAGKMLTVNNCSFVGDFYAIRSRTLFSITNSNFDVYTGQGTLAAVFTWGNGTKGTKEDAGANSVTFTGNTNLNSNKIYGVQLTSTTFNYCHMNINVQDNTNFYQLSESVYTAACDFTGCTFAQGSETFDYSGVKSVSTAEDLKKAISAAVAGDVISLASGSYEGFFDLTHKNLTIQEAEGAEATIKGMVWADDCTVTLKGLTLTNPEGVQHPNTQNSQYYNTINNQYPAVGAYNKANIKFEGCTFELTGPTVYGFYGYAHNTPVFDGCTFNCNQIRPIANNGDALTITGCTFNDQYHYSARIFENGGERQTVIFTDNKILGKNNENKEDFEGINISRKSDPATIFADFTIKGNTAGVKFRHHKNVTMDASCTYDTDITNFAFEKEVD